MTGANVDNEGSVPIDHDLLDATVILTYEQIHLPNIDSGARRIAYSIDGTRGSGTVCVDGTAARPVNAGDRVAVASIADERAPTTNIGNWTNLARGS